MNLKYALTMVAYFGLTQGAWSQYAVGLDQGSGLTAKGVLPIPGYGVTPFWGGSSIAANNVVAADYDLNGHPQPILNGLPLPISNYEYGGVVNVASNVTNGGVDNVGYAGGFCVDGNCGYFPPHAALWPSTGGFFDLHPAGFSQSTIQGLDGNGIYVGLAIDTTGLIHPMQWFGTSSMQELSKPSGFTQAAATAINSTEWVGGWGVAANGAYHPITWLGGLNNYVVRDVLPKNSVSGAIVTTDPATAGRFGGSVTPKTSGGQVHAALWPNPQSNNVIDLNGGYVASSVFAMRTLGQKSTIHNLYEAGLGVVQQSQGPVWHGLVWRSSANSVVDLNNFLPAGFSQSAATGIDESGNVEGVALDAAGSWHQMIWVKQ